MAAFDVLHEMSEEDWWASAAEKAYSLGPRLQRVCVLTLSSSSAVMKLRLQLLPGSKMVLGTSIHGQVYPSGLLHIRWDT